MSFRMFQFFFPDTALFCFYLAAPGKLHHRVSSKSLPGTPYHHRTGRPAVSPGQTKLAQTKLVPTQTFSAARIFALRDRGLPPTFRPVSAPGAPPPAVLSDRPVHGLRRFGELEKFGSQDESKSARVSSSLTGPRLIQPRQVASSCVSAATGQWLWRFSATSFPHRIRKSHRPARARRCGLPLVRRSRRTSGSSACPAVLPPEN